MRQLTYIMAASLLLLGCVPEPDAEISGAELFVNHCSACHGAQGEGDGPVASVMQVSVPNLRTLSQRNDGTFPVESATAYIDGRELPVSHGDRYMPIWGNVFAWPGSAGDEQTELAAQRRIATVVEFIRQMQYR